MFKIGDKVNFKHEDGDWDNEIFTITGFITDEQLQREINATYEVGIIGKGGKTIRHEIRKAHENADEIRTVYLNWDCHWFPIQAKRLRIAE